MLIFTHISQHRLQLPGKKMHFALGLHSGWTKAKSNLTKLLVQRHWPFRCFTLQNRSKGTCEGLFDFECFSFASAVSLCSFCESINLHMTQQCWGVGGKQLEKEKGREGSGMRIQGKDGRNLNRSLLDRSPANIKYFHYINSWSGVFFFYYLQAPHWRFLCLLLWWLLNQLFRFTLFRKRDFPSDWQKYYNFCNHSPKISHQWYWLCLWDTVCTFSDKSPELPQGGHWSS